MFAVGDLVLLGEDIGRVLEVGVNQSCLVRMPSGQDFWAPNTILRLHTTAKNTLKEASTKYLQIASPYDRLFSRGCQCGAWAVPWMDCHHTSDCPLHGLNSYPPWRPDNDDF